MLRKLIRLIDKGHKHSKAIKTSMYAAGTVLVFFITYMMILPAITIEKDAAANEPGMNITSQSVRESDSTEIGRAHV